MCPLWRLAPAARRVAGCPRITLAWARRDGRGQSLTELSLAMPIVLLFLLGAVNLGLALRSQTSLSQATQQAAQYLIHHPSVNCTSASTCAAADASVVQNYLAVNGYPNAAANVSFSQTTTQTSTQSLLATIGVTSSFPVVMPLANLINSGPLHNGSVTLGASADTIMATPAPTNLQVAALPGVGFHLSWQAPVTLAGVPVSSYHIYWFGTLVAPNSPATSPSYNSGTQTWSYDDDCQINPSTPACSTTGSPLTYAYGVTAVQNNGLESPAVTKVSP